MWSPSPRSHIPHRAPSASGHYALTEALDPRYLLGAYRVGYFPMPVDGAIGWFSPDPRGIIPLDGVRVTRSLRRSARRYDVTVDTAFGRVIRACADPARPHGWIDDEIIAAYERLHDLGYAHSVEAWSPETGELAGGLYGVALGGLFAGESMFSVARDASKVALVALVDRLRDGGGVLLDVQWLTDHLASLGAVEVARDRYLELLATAVERPQLGLGFR